MSPLSACQAGDICSIPELWRSPGEGKGDLLPYSCLGNLMDRVAWQAKVHGVSKSGTWLSDLNNNNKMSPLGQEKNV